MVKMPYSTAFLNFSSSFLRPMIPYVGIPLSMWRMASVTPDLPSQLQSITALWPVPNYIAWWQRHVCVCEQLAQIHYLKVEWREIESWLEIQHPNQYTTTKVCKISSQKSSIRCAVPPLSGNISGWSCDRWGESVFSCRKPHRLKMPSHSLDAEGIDIK